jgi:Tfp pilus assembly protein PilF
MDGTRAEAKRLRRNVEWALQRALDPSTVLPMLHRLSRVAEDGSDESIYAQRRLAELLADHHPWRAALSARRVLAVRPDDDGAWAILALCHAVLGNFRCAVSAYRRALALSPVNAAYAHNLGHILDVALDRPREAVPCLRAAYELGGRRTEVAASLVHALGRAGEMEEARRVSRRALARARVAAPDRGDDSMLREHTALAEWLDAGAKSQQGLLPRRPPARTAQTPWKQSSQRRRTRRDAAWGSAEDLEVVLGRGLARLPLDAKQRARARTIAREPAMVALLHDEAPTLASAAAAVAYTVVYVDHVPLTQAEVAACFRVSAPALRGVFKALRVFLDLGPRDARATADRPG